MRDLYVIAILPVVVLSGLPAWARALAPGHTPRT
jgi:hypothetical protein